MKFKFLFALLLPVLLVTGCGQRPVNLSPEGNAAFYGEQFLSAVREAQKLVGVAGDTNPALQKQLLPALDVFKTVFEGGQTAASALRMIDQSGVSDSDKAQAAEVVRVAMLAADIALQDILLNIESPEAKKIVSEVIRKVELAKAVFQVWQTIGPLLSRPAA